jgi:hypothetical protein
MKSPRPLSTRTRYAVIFVIGMATTAVVLLLVWAIVVAATNSKASNDRSESREPQVAKNDQTLAAVRANTRVIKDCTQVGGECYERGQAQTAAILASAQKIIILSAACSADVSTDRSVDQRIAAITACVTDRLTKPKP